ncbi:hypothetical protein [Paraurantiacibacter namhicola]|uniref:Uncharacterized protein n=1 Tax=Paraurantiacibacter namhicola TaxID=645517 RepID=A0A1C7D5W9_9SPHN|nr:hypothetical protein [Paraurantiacibacter namhicola]ANU06703.1 hypothetical protein A6F65_00378 [Paraurantiacibacter namhicola]
MTRLALLSLAPVAAMALAAAPAAAQDEGGDRVNTLIIYGDDPCPQSAEDEIVVCARLDEGERYRIPENLRLSDSPANEAWASRVQSFETVGKFGPLSCSTVGLGSELGCTAELIDAAYKEKENNPGVRFEEIIAQERANRLAEIDGDAAEQQARVEEIEEERLGSGFREVDPNAQPVVVSTMDGGSEEGDEGDEGGE